jgi:hypothetical protein
MDFTWRNWSAWRDRKDEGTSAIRVHGECVFPAAGYNVELMSLEGGNPHDLLVNLIVRPPRERATEVETPVPADYILQDEGDQYRTVTIKRQNGESIRLDIGDQAPESLERAA